MLSLLWTLPQFFLLLNDFSGNPLMVINHIHAYNCTLDLISPGEVTTDPKDGLGDLQHSPTPVFFSDFPHRTMSYVSYFSEPGRQLARLY